MNNPPKVEVQFSARFLKDIRKLQKRFPSLQADLQPFITRLQQGEFPGDQIRGTRHTVYKARLPNRDSKRGQSGGYRVIYFLRTQTHTVLLTIYSKSDIEDVSPREIADIIRDVLG
jgi:mRNA-degrading endonuclease RelE of RelBE toxin-antitoxin system